MVIDISIDNRSNRMHALWHKCSANYQIDRIYQHILNIFIPSYFVIIINLRSASPRIRVRILPEMKPN